MYLCSATSVAPAALLTTNTQRRDSRAILFRASLSKPRRATKSGAGTWPDAVSLTTVVLRRAAALGIGMLSSLVLADNASAFAKIELTDIRSALIDCPKGLTSMTMGKPSCLKLTATAINPTKLSYTNVDVFGRVFDGDGQNALDRDEASDAGRIANLKSISPGTSEVSFDVRNGGPHLIIVSSDAIASGKPLKFKAFKAVAYPVSMQHPLALLVAATGGAFTGNTPVLAEGDCDLTSLGCEEDLNALVP